MAKPVVVTRITIDYVCDGRAFTMVFNEPSKIESIVLGRVDLFRLQEAQTVAEGKPLRIDRFVPDKEADNLTVVPDDEDLEPLPALPISITGGTEVSSPASVNLARSLWWHNDMCNWVHPEGDE